jgi:hypothetical protein
MTVERMRKKIKDLMNGGKPDQEGLNEDFIVANMEIEAEVPEEKHRFHGLAGEVWEIFQLINNLPDLLLFIDNTCDMTEFEDRETLLQQKFIDEILELTKNMSTTPKVFKFLS